MPEQWREGGRGNFARVDDEKAGTGPGLCGRRAQLVGPEATELMHSELDQSLCLVGDRGQSMQCG
jgi:hypothetical protein